MARSSQAQIQAAMANDELFFRCHFCAQEIPPYALLVLDKSWGCKTLHKDCLAAYMVHWEATNDMRADEKKAFFDSLVEKQRAYEETAEDEEKANERADRVKANIDKHVSAKEKEETEKEREDRVHANIAKHVAAKEKERKEKHDAGKTEEEDTHITGSTSPSYTHRIDNQPPNKQRK